MANRGSMDNTNITKPGRTDQTNITKPGRTDKTNITKPGRTDKINNKKREERLKHYKTGKNKQNPHSRRTSSIPTTLPGPPSDTRSTLNELPSECQQMISYFRRRQPHLLGRFIYKILRQRVFLFIFDFFSLFSLFHSFPFRFTFSSSHH